MRANEQFIITGASGFLGKIIYENLKSGGYVVTGFGTGQHLKKIDLTKPVHLGQGMKAEVVVHVAGKAHIVPKTEQEKQSFFDINYKGTINFCTALDKYEALPKCFVFISTVAVYGLDEGEMITEDFPLNGYTPYARSKIMAENWLHQWAAERNINLVILRLPLIAGFAAPGNFGAMVKGIRSGRYLSIGNGSARKSMVWCNDISSIIPSLSDKNGVFNLTDGRHPSFRQIETALSAKYGNKIRQIPFKFARLLARVGDTVGDRFPLNSENLKKITSTLTFDDRMAVDILGWRPTPVIEHIIATE